MNGETDQPLGSQEIVEGAELCPKCLGLVFREDGICKHCGERVFPMPDSTPPSAEDEAAFGRKCQVATFWGFAVLAGLKVYTLVGNWTHGSASSWRDWTGLLISSLGIVAALYALRSRSKPNGNPPAH